MISYLKSAFGLNPRRGPASLTARAACSAQPAGAAAQRNHGRAPRSRSKSDPIASDLTR
jgi:hypothetical protein